MNPLRVANPVRVTKSAVGLAGAAVGLSALMAREAAHLLSSGLGCLEQALEKVPGAERTGSPETAGVPEANTRAPKAVVLEPQVPEAPPVDVVGETLAAESAAEPGDGPATAGLTHEPRGSTRDEEHGEAALQRAEVDEIAEEAAAALDGDVEAEEHLSEPLLGSADAKAAAAELRTMGKAADPDKG